MGVGGQRYTPAALPQGKTQCPLYRRLGGTQGGSGRMRKIFRLPGFDPQTVKPVASSYTDWAIPAYICYIMLNVPFTKFGKVLQIRAMCSTSILRSCTSIPSGGPFMRKHWVSSELKVTLYCTHWKLTYLRPSSFTIVPTAQTQNVQIIWRQNGHGPLSYQHSPYNSCEDHFTDTSQPWEAQISQSF